MLKTGGSDGSKISKQRHYSVNFLQVNKTDKQNYKQIFKFNGILCH